MYDRQTSREWVLCQIKEDPKAYFDTNMIKIIWSILEVKTKIHFGVGGVWVWLK